MTFFGWSSADPLPGLVRVRMFVVNTPMASVRFGDLPQYGGHLRVTFSVRGDASGVAASTFQFILNDDAGSNYNWQRVKAAATSPSSAESLGTTSVQLSDAMPTSTATANRRLTGELLIYEYADNLWEKDTRSLSGWSANNTTSSTQPDLIIGHWRSTTSPVTSITFLPGTGNIVAGSVFRLYIEQ